MTKKQKMAKITVVVGPPCAGKSTYVSSNRKEGDVVVDADAIAKALGAPNAHVRTGVHRGLVFGARQSVINRVLAGIDADSWVIHTSPEQSLVDRYFDAGAEFVLLDPGKESCHARAAQDNRPEGTVEVIDAWYDNPPKLKRTDRGKGVVWLLPKGGVVSY